MCWPVETLRVINTRERAHSDLKNRGSVAVVTKENKEGRMKKREREREERERNRERERDRLNRQEVHRGNEERV